jgi:hypothetical protein
MTSAPPSQPKIYHITHVDNLRSIVEGGGLISDATIVQRDGPPMTIGMSKIKQRRLALPVSSYPGDCVGDYVPFYFGPRSVMLFLMYRGNHPEVTYTGGQGPIVHLEADLTEVVAWADTIGKRWAFTLSNAGAYYAEFRTNLEDLDQIDWNAVTARNWQGLREAKQAEFLVHGDFPWELVSKIGVMSVGILQQVETILSESNHRPKIAVEPNWYY